MNKLMALPILLLLASSCDKDKKKADDNVGTATKIEVSDKEKPSPNPATDHEKKPDVPSENHATTSEYVSADHKFSVQSLRQPRIDTTSTTTALGKIELTTYMFNEKGAPGAYGVMVSQLPFSDTDGDEARIKAIDDAQTGLISKYNGTVSHVEDLKLEHGHGREFDLQATHPQMGAMSGHFKVVIRDKTMYQVMQIGAPDANALIAEAASVLASFKLTE